MNRDKSQFACVQTAVARSSRDAQWHVTAPPGELLQLQSFIGSSHIRNDSGKFFFSFVLGEGWGGGGKTMAWWSLVTCDSHDLALMFRKLFLDGKKCLLPPPPSPPCPFRLPSFCLSLFVYRCTDMCASQHSGYEEAPMSRRGGTPPIDIKLAHGCLSCTCLAIFWSARLD